MLLSGVTRLGRVTSPVVRAVGGRSHGGVRRVWNEPEEVPFGEQAHLLPVLLGKVVAVSVEVPKKHHVLPGYKRNAITMTGGL